MRELDLKTGAQTQFIDITAAVRSAVSESGIKNGMAFVFVPHTTAGITINENADPDVVTDITGYLNRLVPESQSFRHSEGNSAAHIKTLLTGSTVQIPVDQGRLDLGTWQGIYFCEYDGPRNRRVKIRVLGG